MICIHPDVIEIMPKSCNDCTFAFYDETHGGGTFYCGISRFTVNKERKQKIRHKGCGIFDPDQIEVSEKDNDSSSAIPEEEMDDIDRAIKAIKENKFFDASPALVDTAQEPDITEEIEMENPNTDDNNVDTSQQEEQ